MDENLASTVEKKTNMPCGNPEVEDHPPILIFDFDGVILNSTGSLMAMEQAMQDPRYSWDKKELQQYMPMDIIRLFEAATHPNYLQLVKMLSASFQLLLPNLRKRFQFFLQTGKLSRELEWQHSDFFPNYALTFERLKEKKVVLGIVTNSGEKRISKWLQRKDASRYFANMVTRKDRRKLGTKPSPKPILGLLDRLRSQCGWKSVNLSHVAFVGDNLSDILAAQRAGVISIACLSGHGEATELKNLAPDFIFENISDIPPNLAKIFPHI